MDKKFIQQTDDSSNTLHTIITKSASFQISNIIKTFTHRRPKWRSTVNVRGVTPKKNPIILTSFYKHIFSLSINLHYLMQWCEVNIQWIKTETFLNNDYFAFSMVCMCVWVCDAKWNICLDSHHSYLKKYICSHFMTEYKFHTNLRIDRNNKIILYMLYL